jgi:hypothetical protein
MQMFCFIYCLFGINGSPPPRTDYMNANKLPQDHPCVIENIRKHYLNKPPPSDAPLKLDSHDLKDRSRQDRLGSFSGS